MLKHMILTLPLIAGIAVAQAPNDEEMGEAVGAYATCLARAAPGGVRSFVLGRARRAPMASRCEPEHMSGIVFAGDNRRYALAEAMLLADFPTGVPAGLASVPVMDHGRRPSEGAGDRAAAMAEADTVWSLGMIGDCVARAQPAASFALVKSDGVAAERAALDQLKPAIAGCLPAGATVRLSHASLRGAIALYLYRLSAAAGGRR